MPMIDLSSLIEGLADIEMQATTLKEKIEKELIVIPRFEDRAIAIEHAERIRSRAHDEWKVLKEAVEAAAKCE